jgi:hypothetical protein
VNKLISTTAALTVAASFLVTLSTVISIPVVSAVDLAPRATVMKLTYMLDSSVLLNLGSVYESNPPRSDCSPSDGSPSSCR